jgi:flagellar basal-body rod modification protein FlgD
MITSATTSTAAGGGATSAPTSITGGAGGKLGKDEFLKLLVAQLKNQDPSNPSDGKDMAAQLAQFSSVEQLQNINASLESQYTGQSSLFNLMSGSVALGTVGKTVLASGDQFTVPAAGSASVTVDVGGSGGRAVVHVLDAAGREVATRDVGAVGGGRQTITVGAAGGSLPAGTYRYKVDVTSGKESVDVTSYVTGRVDGVQYGKDGSMLTVGGITIALGSVVEVKNN